MSATMEGLSASNPPTTASFLAMKSTTMLIALPSSLRLAASFLAIKSITMSVVLALSLLLTVLFLAIRSTTMTTQASTYIRQISIE